MTGERPTQGRSSLAGRVSSFARGIRLRLVLLVLIVAGVSLAAAQIAASRRLTEELEGRVVESLDERATLAARWIADARAFDPETANRVVRSIAEANRARVTLVAPDGRVVADSEVSRERLHTLENHATRPEVADARTVGRGVAERRSGTIGRSLRYVAERVPGDVRPPWVVRIAVEPQRISAQRLLVYRLLAGAGVAGLVVTAIFAWFVAQLFTQPVRQLTLAARQMVLDRSMRTSMKRDDEIGALAGALDGLADDLNASLDDLRAQRDRLEAMLESMVEGVLVLDGLHRVVLANRAAREIVGFATPDLTGREASKLLASAGALELFAEVQHQRAPVSRELVVGQSPQRRVLVRAAPLENASSGLVAVLSDVTELRRLETVRRDFVANVSHELRTPITAIRTAVETLEDGALAQPDTAQEFVAIIHRHADRMHRLVEDLLELSRIEARQLRLSPEPVDAESVVHAVIELLAIAAREKQIELRMEVAAPHCTVLADRRALEQVLVNLVDNAIKYGAPEGAVTIRIARAGARVRLVVQDTGPGIESRHLPRLFERFYRVDTGRSRQLGGTGLGLAIVKHLTEAMGGAVSVESKVGAGTTFQVDLPSG